MVTRTSATFVITLGTLVDKTHHRAHVFFSVVFYEDSVRKCFFVRWWFYGAIKDSFHRRHVYCFISKADGVDDSIINAFKADSESLKLLKQTEQIDDENDLLGPVSFIGQIDVPYSNNVRVDGDNLIISTEDGIYLYLIKYLELLDVQLFLQL